MTERLRMEPFLEVKNFEEGQSQNITFTVYSRYSCRPRRHSSRHSIRRHAKGVATFEAVFDAGAVLCPRLIVIRIEVEGAVENADTPAPLILPW